MKLEDKTNQQGHRANDKKDQQGQQQKQQPHRPIDKK
jgi:hypothetical protein